MSRLARPPLWAKVLAAMTVLHGSGRGRIEAVHSVPLRDTDGFRASEFQHAVQDADGDGHLGLLACTRA